MTFAIRDIVTRVNIFWCRNGNCDCGCGRVSGPHKYLSGVEYHTVCLAFLHFLTKFKRAGLLMDQCLLTKKATFN